MHVHIRAFCERAADAKPGSPISFVASTSDLARDGMTIDANGWKLDNYRASPVVLWSHDYMGNRPPIGRADNVRVDGGKLMADITFDQGDPFARDVERKYREGFISAVSVGWDTLEFKPDDPNQPGNGGKVLSAELLDISAVNVPGDPKALIERQKRAYRDLGEAVWAEVFRVLRPGSVFVVNTKDPLNVPFRTDTEAQLLAAGFQFVEVRHVPIRGLNHGRNAEKKSSFEDLTIVRKPWRS